MSQTLSVSLGQFSSGGPKPENEDFYGAITPDGHTLELKGVVVAIADGMSGSGEGREASEYAVKGLLMDYYSTPDSWGVKTAVQKVLGATNNWLYSQSHKQHGVAGALGTTLSALILKSGSAHLFHVGDSRIHQFRDGRLERITEDHRVVLAGGRSYLSRAMGIEPHLQVDYRSVPLETGDIFVLSTDGVHDFLSEHDLEGLLRDAGRDLDETARTIVERALANGGNDNTTCELVRIDGLPLEQVDELYRRLAEVPFPPELEPGMVLDGYRIEREIHASRRSQLYIARDTETGERVVLKTPSVNFEDDLVYIEQFAMEEWVGRRIHNPHVLRVCEQRRKRHFLYHVTEFVEGQTLREWIQTHPQPDIAEAIELVDQIAQGLRAFHRLEMVHRDLKPENILIDAGGTAWIIDFGSVKTTGIHELAVPLDRDALVGTEDYTAPEYHIGATGDNASDLFALGVITYEILTGGAHPYSHKVPRRPTPCRDRYVPAPHHNPMIPPWLDGAIAKAVRCNPTDRYESISEYLYDLVHPNQAFLRTTPLPLIERNPVAFWRGLAVISLLVNAVLIVVMIGGW